MKIQSLAEFRGKITGAILYDLLKVIEDAGLTTGLQHGECWMKICESVKDNRDRDPDFSVFRVMPDAEDCDNLVFYASDNGLHVFSIPFYIFLDGKESGVAGHDVVCCFCARQTKDSCAVVISVRHDDESTQGLFAHRECFRAHLHPSVPFLASGDVLDGQ